MNQPAVINLCGVCFAKKENDTKLGLNKGTFVVDSYQPKSPLHRCHRCNKEIKETVFKVYKKTKFSRG